MPPYDKARGKTAACVLGALSLLLLCPSALASDPSLESQYAHTTWKVSEGFSKGAILSIAQTQDGYIWLGTELGLLRFDGVRATPWQPPGDQHLPSSTVWSLLAARDGTLWIGTAQGLSSWKGGKLTQYPELAGQFIYALLEDREGTIWAGGTVAPLGKLCAIQHGRVQCYGTDGVLGTAVTGLYEDSKGSLWVGVKNGLWQWKPGPPKFYPLPGEPYGIQAIGEDADGTLLVGWKGGIHRFIQGKTKVYPVPGTVQPFKAHKLLRDRDGGLWIGTWDRGLMHVHHGRTDVFAPPDGLLAEGVSNDLFEDREGSIWVATVNGLDKFCAVATSNLKVGVPDAMVDSVLAARDGSVWLSTNRGLNLWNNGQISTYDKREGKLNGGVPNSLFQDSRGRIWVSTFDGVGYLENDRFVSVTSFPGGAAVHAMAEDTAGNLWIANQDSGLFQLFRDRVVQRIPWAKLGHKDHANVLAADPLQGGLWLGFFQGGIAYFEDGQVRASYSPADGLGDGVVTDLRFDRDGTLWVATAGGLSRLKNGRVVTLTSKSGLPCDGVNWVIEDDAHFFWLNTPCGLVRIARTVLDDWAAAVDEDKHTKRTVEATVFDSSDGVRLRHYPGGFSPHVGKSPDGKLWFANLDGVNVVDPRHLPFNKIPPPVQIESVTADRKKYWQNLSGDSSSSRPRLPPLVRDITIDYTAPSFVAPEKVLFRYKLEGLDRDWQDVGSRRQAFYTSLSPGNYRFRVAACNNNGVWNEAGTFLDFSIAPAYYQTTWFLVLCVATSLAMLWMVYQVRMREVRRQERKLRDVVETIPTVAWSALPNGAVDFVNRNWEEYTGLSTEKTVGSGWQEAVHPEDLEWYAEKWRASITGGEPFENEVRLRRAADGQYLWFLTRAVPLRDGRGRVLKWYGTSTEIEDRKRAEQLQGELAHVNRVTTLGELTASLAHEINQPIGAAVTNAQACLRFLNRDQPDLREAREAAVEMIRDATRGADIIDRVRSLYRKGFSKMELVDVNEVIREMVVMLHNQANRCSVMMRAELCEALPQVTADRVQLQQVFMNLMVNGMEAMREIGGELSIKSELAEDGQLLISVSDTGVGLPIGKVDEIFNAFFTTKPQGTGMGLAITRSIVESHGGRVWATGNTPRGATFQFTLPSKRAAYA
jgi:PAS domain S-box-containing protein